MLAAVLCCAVCVCVCFTIAPPTHLVVSIQYVNRNAIQSGEIKFFPSLILLIGHWTVLWRSTAREHSLKTLHLRMTNSLVACSSFVQNQLFLSFLFQVWSGAGSLHVAIFGWAESALMKEGTHSNASEAIARACRNHQAKEWSPNSFFWNRKKTSSVEVGLARE
jgi:hypothetical protein